MEIQVETGSSSEIGLRKESITIGMKWSLGKREDSWTNMTLLGLDRDQKRCTSSTS